MNIVILVVFFGLSALVLGSALMVVLVKNIIHAALWLTASFLGVAALYLFMEAEFLAVVQVLIYAGAISILMLFAIMLTRHITGEGTRQLYERWWVALIVALVLFGVLLTPQFLKQRDAWDEQNFKAQELVVPEDQALVPARQPTALPGEAPVAPAPAQGRLANANTIGVAFMREFLLPFEVASVLLLVALVGAIVIAYPERKRRKRVLTLAEQVARRQLKPVEPAEDVAVALSPSGQEGT